jgi:alpha-beta hydrolase superfamily lysophospholipase
MRAIPFHFGPHGSELFGWHHPREGTIARRSAVVLCPPIAYDYMCVYRSWQILADRLSGAGFDVFRFDYRGTGDSAGSADEPNQLAGWLASIPLAVEAAKSRSGAGSVVLVGMRLGATLAASAGASLEAVDQLVLWDPYRLGKAWVREVRAFAQLGHTSDAPVGDDLSVAGFLLTGATAAELGSVDLGALGSLCAKRTLIIERDDRSPDLKLAAHLRALGSEVTVDRLPGTSDSLVEPRASVVPEAILDRIVGWVGGGPQVTTTAAALPAAGDEYPANGLRERPIFFGPDRRLFGVLSMPALPDPGAPALIVLNTGSLYHVGPHRLYVPLARQWAALGHHVFRFDLGGIGDSKPPGGAPLDVAYPPHGLDDVRAAVELVRAETGAIRVLLIGICAGGWHAFDAARSGVPIDGFVGINPPLYLREGPAYETDGLREEIDVQRYTRSLTRLDKWKKVLTGKASPRTFLRLAAQSLWRALTRKVVSTMDRRKAGLENELRRISTRGLDALFVFSTRDLSHSYFRLHAGKAGSRSMPRIGVTVVDEADHTFRPLSAQETLRGLLDEFLARSRERRGSGAGEGLDDTLAGPSIPAFGTSRPKASAAAESQHPVHRLADRRAG